MQKQRFNIVTDGQWGSCGKGAITTFLASKHEPEILSTTNMANAGHTAVNTDGEAFIAKALPSATMLRKWIDRYDPHIIVGATAAFNMDQMLKEIEITGSENQLTIHDRAGVITDDHKTTESTDTLHLASTMQGCGAMLADKIMRKQDLKLARDYDELYSYMPEHLERKLSAIDPYILENIEGLSLPQKMIKLMKMYGLTILHEGAQGFSLDINHGSHYPQCTSRGTTATTNLADMGIPCNMAGDIYLVIRPYPIRVGNVVKDGEVLGHSGGHYDDHVEMTWKDVAEEAGAPPEVMKGELTTVTKRLRRVFSFSMKQLIDAVEINGATKIALNFANYIDYSCLGVNDPNKLSDKIMIFIDKVEQTTGVPVTLVGTGPRLDHVCVR